MERSPLDAVLVIGAAGRTGQIVVRDALDAGYRVTALVRSSGSGLPVREGLSVVTGDARDAEILRAALSPGGAVVSTIGTTGRDSHGLYAQTGRAVVAAAEAAGVRRVVAITSSGLNAHDDNHPWWYRRFLIPFIRPTYDDMAEMEAAITTSALDWTIVRPSRLTDEPATGRYRIGDGHNPPGGVAVSRADLSRFIVAQLDQRDWVRRRPTLAR